MWIRLRYKAKGMPSGPQAVFLGILICLIVSSRVGMSGEVSCVIVLLCVSR